MTNFIKLDNNEHLQSKYPNLPPDQIDLIASDVSNRWDYRDLIDTLDIKCKQTAYYANIELGDKNDNEALEMRCRESLHKSNKTPWAEQDQTGLASLRHQVLPSDLCRKI